MKHRLAIFAAAIALLVTTPLAAYAAEFHSGDSLSFTSSDQLKDAYIAGGTITVDGNIGQSARIAGGTVTVNGTIARDLIIAGGDVTISDKATVQGDLVIMGGTITVDGPVTGKVIINGGEARINGAVGSVANTHVDRLTLGPKALINGNLSYQATQKAKVEGGAQIKGRVDFQPQTDRGYFAAGRISAASFFYGLLSSLIFGFVLLYLGYRLTNQSVNLLKQRPWQSLGWGLGAIFLFPILAVILMIVSVWLGIVSLILYVLALMVAAYLAQILLGWWLLQWWFGRTKENYLLDWRAVIVGVAVSTILLLVPVIGWTILAIMMTLAMGTLAQAIWNLRLRS